MAVQQHQLPESPAAPLSAPQPAAGPAPIWVQRISLFILVLFCIYLGAIVTYLPWWTAAWERNPLFEAHPILLAFIRLGPVRGVVSGLGLLDIWIGISEAIHYREAPGA